MRLKFFSLTIAVSAVCGVLVGCAGVNVPDARNVEIPNPISAEKRVEAVNERPDSVMYLPLGEDVLVPERMVGENLPKEIVGPFELRGETLGGALQLILADYDISIAFESERGLTKRVTVANLKGSLDKVVNRVCSLADLYCSYEDGTLVVKDVQTFTVSLPPLGDAEGGQEFIGDVISGLSAVIGNSGSTPVSDPTTRTIIYSATQRTSQLAENYFERLRANTAMIVFETYIWEVSLNTGNSTGIDWTKLGTLGQLNVDLSLNGAVSSDFTNPVSIGLPTSGQVNPVAMVEFLAQFGAVKTISQPQITVLSGSSAELRVADTENYVSEVSSTISGDNTTTSVSTDSVDSGFTLAIGSSWDKSTVYANVNINLTNVDDIEDFAFDTDGAGGSTTIQLPQTTERELTTQIRVRPGDSVLIAGLVRERDNFNSRGPGFMEPIIPDSRTALADNLELVILLRPRVIVYTANDNPQYRNFVNNKAEELLAKRLAQSAPAAAASMPVQPVAPMMAQPPIAQAAPAPVRQAVRPAPVTPIVAQPVQRAPIVEQAIVSEPVMAKPAPPAIEYPQYNDPAPVEVTRVAPAPIMQPSILQPVTPSAQVSTNYQPAVRQAAPSSGYQTPSYNAPKPYVNNVSDYSNDYKPSPRVSGYVPRYVSGQVSSGYESRNPVMPSAPIASNASVSMPRAVVSSTSSYNTSSNVPSNTYKPVKSPISADIYNQAKPLNVYDIYEQSEKNQ